MTTATEMNLTAAQREFRQITERNLAHELAGRVQVHVVRLSALGPKVADHFCLPGGAWDRAIYMLDSLHSEARLMMLSELNRCECGRPGVHPYPIGGGWALACDRCKMDATCGRDTAASGNEGWAMLSTWSRWQREARGQS